MPSTMVSDVKISNGNVEVAGAKSISIKSAEPVNCYSFELTVFYKDIADIQDRFKPEVHPSAILISQIDENSENGKKEKFKVEYLCKLTKSGFRGIILRLWSGGNSGTRTFMEADRARGIISRAVAIVDSKDFDSDDVDYELDVLFDNIDDWWQENSEVGD